MKKLILAVVLLAFALSQAVAADTTELARQVRGTETAFAKTMADRDWAAFKAFVSPEAVFFGGRGVRRGREAVAESWKPYFEGPAAPFSWQRPRL